MNTAKTCLLLVAITLLAGCTASPQGAPPGEANATTATANPTASAPVPDGAGVERFEGTYGFTMAARVDAPGDTVGARTWSNCVVLNTTGPTAVIAGEATATWDATAPTAASLQLVAALGEESLRVEGTSPLRLPLALATTEQQDSLLVYVEVPDGGAALNQEVTVDLAFDYVGASPEDVTGSMQNCYQV